ncbi:Transcription factor, subunit of SRB subcomplex of RNA polymerase II [Phaffia rhodozyma]|uniref:Mediator of RNA polymerase II transcription subunit 10 n=1 Tax=Phaffia rhodozyma TaxID=264483 RepID=A0A0F7SI67_PHARH|nr:Transcription factor, subunit of SRB subcomplex of RNA polymerase II [Phaffia rhodozyma]
MDQSSHLSQSNTSLIGSTTRPDPTTLELESTLLTLFQSLTEMQVAASSVQPTKEGLAAGAASRTLDSLFQLSEMKPRIEAKVPMEVLDLIDQDKNPHQFTRNKIEEAVGSNQYSHGKLQAISSYHSLLEKSLLENFPELLQDEQPTAGLANDHTEMKVEEPMRNKQFVG